MILPVRDGDPFLRDALESVLTQTLADFELLVVDDGSTDETPSILAEVRDERLRMVRQEPLGLVAALNRAIDEARALLREALRRRRLGLALRVLVRPE